MSYYSPYEPWYARRGVQIGGGAVVVLGLGFGAYFFLGGGAGSAATSTGKPHTKITGSRGTSTGTAIQPPASGATGATTTSGTATSTATQTQTTASASPILSATPPKAWTTKWNTWGTQTLNRHFGTTAKWDWVADVPGSSGTYLWIVPLTRHGQVDYAEQTGSKWTFLSAPVQGKMGSPLQPGNPVSMSLSLLDQLEGTSGKAAFPNGAPPAVGSAYIRNSINSYNGVGLTQYTLLPAEPYVVTGLLIQGGAQSSQINLNVYASADGQISDFLFSYNASGRGWVWDGFSGGALTVPLPGGTMLPKGPNDSLLGPGQGG